MRAKRARDIRKEVLKYIEEQRYNMRVFKNIYRRTKRNYTRGIA